MKVFLYSVLVGIFSGLAGESKLTGLLCACIAIVVSVIGLYKYKLKLVIADTKRIIISTFTIGIFTTFVFIGSYPFFYHDPISRIIKTFQFRQSMMDYQVSVCYNDVISSSQRTKILLNRLFSYPIYIPDKTYSYTLDPFIINMPDKSRTNPLGLFIMNMCIAAYGALYGVRNILNNRDNKMADSYIILIISTAIICAPTMFTPLDWDRYYLFPIFFTCIYFSIGISQISFSLIDINIKQIRNIVNRDNLTSFQKRIRFLFQRLIKYKFK